MCSEHPLLYESYRDIALLKRAKQIKLEHLYVIGSLPQLIINQQSVDIENGWIRNNFLVIKKCKFGKVNKKFKTDVNYKLNEYNYELSKIKVKHDKFNKYYHIYYRPKKIRKVMFRKYWKN